MHVVNKIKEKKADMKRFKDSKNAEYRETEDEDADVEDQDESEDEK